MLRLAIAVFAAHVRSLSAAPPQLSPPVIGAATLFLDGGDWIANSTTTGVVMTAFVPGDIVTDLEAAGLLGDPLAFNNTRGAHPLWDAPFSYTKEFSTPTGAGWDNATDVWLVLEGIKMAADVFLNGQPLGDCRSQFFRRVISVRHILTGPGGGYNALRVDLPTASVDPRNMEGRYSAFSGAWDWAPWTELTVPRSSDPTATQGAFYFSKGVWGSVYLVAAPPASPVLTYIVPHVFLGAPGTALYPTAPLTDEDNGPWAVRVTAHFLAPAEVSGTLTAVGDWTGLNASAAEHITLSAGNSSASLWLYAQDVSLWWPAGCGDQGLYNVTLTFTPDGSANGPTLSSVRRIGFRSFYLVTGNDTDPASLAGVDGSGDFTVRYKVNGADVWSRGASLVPMEALEGRADDAATRRLVLSAAEAGMNTLRVWGGGIYPPESFFDACDEAGIMVLHDMMYAAAVWEGPIVFYHYREEGEAGACGKASPTTPPPLTRSRQRYNER